MSTTTVSAQEAAPARATSDQTSSSSDASRSSSRTRRTAGSGGYSQQARSLVPPENQHFDAGAPGGGPPGGGGGGPSDNTVSSAVGAIQRKVSAKEDKDGSGSALQVSQPNDPAEKEADSIAKIATGQAPGKPRDPKDADKKKDEDEAKKKDEDEAKKKNEDEVKKKDESPNKDDADKKDEANKPGDADKKDEAKKKDEADKKDEASKKDDASKKDEAEVAKSKGDKGQVEAVQEKATCPECGGAMKPKSPGAEPECATCGKKASQIGGTKGALANVLRKPSGADVGQVQLRSGAIKPEGGGEPLAQGVRSAVEPLLGADLSNVRVHSGEAVQAKASALGAKAFTTGSNIFLGKGHTQSDTELMAHEATHVVQQQASNQTPVQRDISDYVPDVVKNAASDVVDAVVPDSILNLLKGKKSEAEDAGPGLEKKAESEASTAKSEATSAESEAKAPAEEGVEKGKSQVDEAASKAQSTSSEAQAKTEAVKAQAEATASQMQTAGPAARHALDPVASITDPSPAGGGGGAPGAGGAAASPAAAEPAAPAPAAKGDGGGGGDAPKATEGSATPPNPGEEIAKGAEGGAPGKWNCDEASVVAMVTEKGREAVNALTRAAKSVVPEEIWNFAAEKIESAKQAAAAIKQKVTDVKNKVVNFVDEKTKPLREAVDKAKSYLSEKYEGAKTFVSDKVNQAKQWASDKWTSLKNKVSTGVSNAIDWAKGKASSVLQSAKNIAGRFWSMVPDWIKGPITSAVGAVGNFVSAAKQKISDAKGWISDKASAFGTWVQGKADGAVQWFANKYNTAKDIVTTVGGKIGEGVGWVKQKGGELAEGAWNLVNNATGGKLNEWKEAAQKKFQDLKDGACGVVGDIAAPCVEKVLPEPRAEGGKTFANIAVTGDVTVPIHGVPVKIAGGASVQIERTGDKYNAVLTGSASLGAAFQLSGGKPPSGGGNGASLEVEGSLPNKARALLKLRGGPGIPGGAPIPLGGGKSNTNGAPGGTGPSQSTPAAPGGGGGAKVGAEVSRKLTVTATYSFDASGTKANTCDGLGGMVTFLGAAGAGAMLPSPFSAMATGATAAAFSDNLTSASATWADTGKIVAEGEIKGLAKGSVGGSVESSTKVGIKRVDGTGDDGKPNGTKETVIEATLGRSISGQAAGSFCPGGLKILGGGLSLGGSASVTMTFNIQQRALNASAKVALTGSITLSGFPGIAHSLPAEVKGPIFAKLQELGISPDTNNGVVSMEVSFNADNLAALASALDAELSKGDGATAAGVYQAVQDYFKSGNVSRKISAKLVLTDKVLGVKASGGKDNAKGSVGVDVTTGEEIPLITPKTLEDKEEKDEGDKKPDDDGGGDKPEKEPPPKKKPDDEDKEKPIVPPGKGRPPPSEKVLKAMKLSGMTRDAVERMFELSKGYIIDMRPTNKYAAAWLEQGHSPKPEFLKMKTVNDIDVYLGCSPGQKGLVAFYEPKLPDNFNDLPPDIQAAIVKRKKQRELEQGLYGKEIEKLKADGVIDVQNGMIIDKREGAGKDKAFTGDYDIFDMRGPNGEPLSPEEKEALLAKLKQPPVNAQHGAHMDWEPEKDEDKKIKEDIIDSHRQVRKDGKKGEALARFGDGDCNKGYSDDLWAQ